MCLPAGAEYSCCRSVPSVRVPCTVNSARLLCCQSSQCPGPERPASSAWSATVTRNVGAKVEAPRKETGGE